MKCCWKNLKYVNTPNTLNTGHFEILKNLKYVNTLNTDHFKISEAKKVKYGIRLIRRIRFFPNLSYNEPYLYLVHLVYLLYRLYLLYLLNVLHLLYLLYLVYQNEKNSCLSSNHIYYLRPLPLQTCFLEGFVTLNECVTSRGQ